MIVIATLLILGGIADNYITTKYEQHISDTRNRATVIAHYIELRLDNRLTALGLLAGDPEIVGLDADQMITELQRAVRELGFFNIVIFDRNGNFITEASPEFHIGQVYDWASFNKALEGRPNISNRIVYDGLETAYVSLRVPIVDDRGTVTAVMVAGMPIKQISDMVNQSVGQSLLRYDEYVFIMDSNLHYVMHPRLNEMYPEEQIMKGAHSELFIDEGGHRMENSVLDKTEKLYSSTPIEHANWRVIIAAPVSSVYLSMVKRSIHDMISFTLLLIIIALCYRVLKQKQAEKLALENFQLERWSCASQMAASVAHEIRNPLTSIKGFIQLIMRKPNQPAPQSYLEIIASEIERIDKLVSEFQMLSRPIKPAQFVLVDIISMVHDVVMLMEGQVLNKKVKLNLDDQLDDKQLINFQVQGDQAQLKQVVINIMRNAIDAVDEQGHIEVTLTQCSEMIAIEIKDDGVGIPEEVLLKIGTPFYTTKPNGTGLGLSVCFNILESHGGKLEIRSKVGVGTTFTIWLPCAPAGVGLES
ncbi:Adaptive-response sensory-kinase SasA [bioreactor metagenome]|uniref:Adaptive-response sensory-kinase SasA n=1 Tax=bioreactor metagenome TaxID=1076179 RepID=A0A644T998_9ZZZZ